MYSKEQHSQEVHPFYATPFSPHALPSPLLLYLAVTRRRFIGHEVRTAFTVFLITDQIFRNRVPYPRPRVYHLEDIPRVFHIMPTLYHEEDQRRTTTLDHESAQASVLASSSRISV